MMYIEYKALKLYELVVTVFKSSVTPEQVIAIGNTSPLNYGIRVHIAAKKML